MDKKEFSNKLLQNAKKREALKKKHEAQFRLLGPLGVSSKVLLIHVHYPYRIPVIITCSQPVPDRFCQW